MVLPSKIKLLNVGLLPPSQHMLVVVSESMLFVTCVDELQCRQDRIRTNVWEWMTQRSGAEIADYTKERRLIDFLPTLQRAVTKALLS